MEQLRMGKCAVCGGILVLNARGRHKKYCSNECRQQASRERKRAARGTTGKDFINHECHWCGIPFTTEKPSTNAKYCSEDCRRAAKRQLVHLWQRENPKRAALHTARCWTRKLGKDPDKIGLKLTSRAAKFENLDVGAIVSPVGKTLGRVNKSCTSSAE